MWHVLHGCADMAAKHTSVSPYFGRSPARSCLPAMRCKWIANGARKPVAIVPYNQLCQSTVVEHRQCWHSRQCVVARPLAPTGDLDAAVRLCLTKLASLGRAVSLARKSRSTAATSQVAKAALAAGACRQGLTRVAGGCSIIARTSTGWRIVQRGLAGRFRVRLQHGYSFMLTTCMAASSCRATYVWFESKLSFPGPVRCSASIQHGRQHERLA